MPVILAAMAGSQAGTASRQNIMSGRHAAMQAGRPLCRQAAFGDMTVSMAGTQAAMTGRETDIHGRQSTMA